MTGGVTNLCQNMPLGEAYSRASDPEEFDSISPSPPSLTTLSCRFYSAYKAIHETIAIVKIFAEDESTMPLNVSMGMRFTKHSDSPISPAYGKEV